MRVQIPANEHLGLLANRNAIWNKIFVRAGMSLTVLPAVVSLALAAQATDVGAVLPGTALLTVPISTVVVGILASLVAEALRVATAFVAVEIAPRLAYAATTVAAHARAGLRHHLEAHSRSPDPGRTGIDGTDQARSEGRRSAPRSV